MEHRYETIRNIAKLGLISEHHLRTLVKRRAIPYLQQGKRVLIDAETLPDTLARLAEQNVERTSR